MYKGREIVFAGRMAFGTVAREALDSIRIGINLTIANIAGNLILGGGRFIIDRYWGIEDFGEVSFSLTLTNFFYCSYLRFRWYCSRHSGRLMRRGRRVF